LGHTAASHSRARVHVLLNKSQKLNEQKHLYLDRERGEKNWLRALEKLRKAALSFFMSVYPSAWGKKKLGSHWKDFHEI
jgi:hypothetical protein